MTLVLSVESCGQLQNSRRDTREKMEVHFELTCVRSRLLEIKLNNARIDAIGWVQLEEFDACCCEVRAWW